MKQPPFKVEQGDCDIRPRTVPRGRTQGGELAILDETKETLARRVARLETGVVWVEDPPSRTRHLIANPEVKSAEAVSELKVYCNFIVYRSRAKTEQDFYARCDLLRRVDGALKITGRKVTVDQNVLLAENVSIYF
jgi:3-phenylpropionate/cinnamic acid dioxygenase small subunit